MKGKPASIRYHCTGISNSVSRALFENIVQGAAFGRNRAKPPPEPSRSRRHRTSARFSSGPRDELYIAPFRGYIRMLALLWGRMDSTGMEEARGACRGAINLVNQVAQHKCRQPVGTGCLAHRQPVRSGCAGRDGNRASITGC